jgi:hypothetical protein
MIDTTITILQMILDLLSGADPTLPADHPELAPVARLLAAIYDWSLTR